MSITSSKAGSPQMAIQYFICKCPVTFLSYEAIQQLLVTGEWRRLHNEELHDLYSPSIVRVIKSRRMRWAGHVAQMRRG
jgi:hypothetical protein